ncbi:MAG: histidinol-phosphate transaminase [Pirellulaceae bacterium]|nr:histidinol-phosphate transaminase [Pirellulaceae bacterium]
MTGSMKNPLDSLLPHIREMEGYVPGEQLNTRKYIKLNTNENPYPPSPDVLVAIQKQLQRGIEQYPDPLATSFRLMAASQLGVRPESILCGNGSDDILTIVTRAFLGTSESLGIPYPSYTLYETLATLEQANIVFVPFTNEWTVDLRKINDSKRLKLFYLPNPNSPTGTVLRKEELIDLAERLPCPLLVDEAYADFTSESAIDLIEAYPNIMVSRTLSKSYSLAGLRFGYLVATPPLIEQLLKVKDSYNCNALSIAAATAAIADQKWFAQNRQKILTQREKFSDELSQLGFEVLPSSANFVWCSHPAHESQTLYKRLRENHILVRYMRYPHWGEGLRITIGTEEQLEALLVILRRLCRQK